MNQTEQFISWNDFSKVDMRIGTVIHVEPFLEAIKPAYKITIDFGELGIKKPQLKLLNCIKSKC